MIDDTMGGRCLSFRYKTFCLNLTLYFLLYIFANVVLNSLIAVVFSHILRSRPSGVVVRGAGFRTKGPGFEFQVRHECRTVRPKPHQWLCSKTGRREVPGSFLSRACRPSRSKCSVFFSETRVNTGQIPQEDLHGGNSTYRLRCLIIRSALKPTTNQPTF